MTLPEQLRAMPEVRGGVLGDARGALLDASPGTPAAADLAAETAAALNALTAAGEAAKLTRLESVLLKCTGSAIAIAARADGFLRLALDPSKATKAVEAALHQWSREAVAVPAPRLTRPTPPPVPAPPVASGATGGQAASASAPKTRSAASDRFAALRRAMVRGHLSEAVTLASALGERPPSAPARAGNEPVDRAALDATLESLLEGVGSILAGDGIGGERALRELTVSAQPNLSFRWLALYWSARAALKSGSLPAARAHVKEALPLGRQLDLESRAVTEWLAGDVLSQDRDASRALAWFADARALFERLGDAWGAAQVSLSEARTLASLEREHEAAEAASRASALDAAWDEPAVFLARRALLRDDVAAAEKILEAVETPAADRVRTVIEAIRGDAVSRADASEYLREHDAPPSARAIQALGRIANAWPRFVPARDALAWMLLKVGKYAEAGSVFRGLLGQPLAPGDRASVMLGLGCISHAQRPARGPAALRAVVAAASVASPAAPAAPREPPPVPQLSGSTLLARGSQALGTLDAVFSGRLSVFAFPDLLEFLRSARRTGLLVCSSARGVAALRLRDGWITGGASPGTPRVGELLLRARKVSPLALHAVQDEPDPVIGEVLVREGIADAAAVKEALEQQVALAIRELVGWTDGEFAFNREPEGGETSAQLSVALDPQAVLLNVFKEMDEQARPAASGVEL
ncbi:MULTISPECIES: DUF4388 domain-containing protein [unclassified Anaeromyxobacter]|uniref:DUF4388 domain-containing protein n=1 Tax=unclassified Anaeromyxobacter TaxID=2620896 RepID=UPI001F5699FF|nr:MULTISPECIES: DUF4388 domain-containing protein [unclassified Anaeromyxobacter]